MRNGSACANAFFSIYRYVLNCVLFLGHGVPWPCTSDGFNIVRPHKLNPGSNGRLIGPTVGDIWLLYVKVRFLVLCISLSTNHRRQWLQECSKNFWGSFGTGKTTPSDCVCHPSTDGNVTTLYTYGFGSLQSSCTKLNPDSRRLLIGPTTWCFVLLLQYSFGVGKVGKVSWKFFEKVLGMRWTTSSDCVCHLSKVRN